MHMYEYLLFELKSEHVFSMPGFGHVAMEKKYTISSIWSEKWVGFTRTLAHRPQIHQQLQKQLPRQRRTFFPGDSGYKTDWQVLAETQEPIILWAKHKHIYIWIHTYIYIFQYMCGNKGTKCNNVYIYIFIYYIYNLQKYILIFKRARTLPRVSSDKGQNKGQRKEGGGRRGSNVGTGSNSFFLLSSIWTDICGYRIRRTKFVKGQSFQN